MESATVHILSVVLVATLVRSAFGFGEALLAVPLLALRIPLQVAAAVGSPHFHHYRLPVDRFRKYIYCGLVIIGGVLAIQAVG
jgi:uncharacterized membrane protein YfcA